MLGIGPIGCAHGHEAAATRDESRPEGSCSSVDPLHARGRSRSRPRRAFVGRAAGRRTGAHRRVVRGTADPRLPPRGSGGRARTGGGMHPRGRVCRGSDHRPFAEGAAAPLPRPVDPADPEPGRPGCAHASERTRRGSEPELPVPVAFGSPGPVLPGTASGLRAGNADRDAPDPADRAGRHDLVPSAPRARRRVRQRRLERRYARLVGLPLVHLGRLHGTTTSWQKHELRGTESFVVELPGGGLRPREVRRFARAVYRLVSPGG
jgi:hypothetical protein